MRVLLVEDDPVSAHSVVNALSAEGYFCDVVTSTQDYNNNMISVGDATGCSNHYDLVILDLHLPGGGDGYDILIKLRNARIKVPVLILSCMTSTYHKAKSLNYGADDYLSKPFHKIELVARIKAIIRRTRGHPESIVRVGDIVINFDHRIVEIKNKAIHLTNKEYAIVELLALRKGTVITKEMFLDHLYSGPDEPMDNKIVDVFMCKVRSKFMKANDGKSHIETVWGRGYVLKDEAEEGTPASKRHSKTTGSDSSGGGSGNTSDTVLSDVHPNDKNSSSGAAGSDEILDVGNGWSGDMGGDSSSQIINGKNSEKIPEGSEKTSSDATSGLLHDGASDEEKGKHRERV